MGRLQASRSRGTSLTTLSWQISEIAWDRRSVERNGGWDGRAGRLNLNASSPTTRIRVVGNHARPLHLLCSEAIYCCSSEQRGGAHKQKPGAEAPGLLFVARNGTTPKAL